MRILNKILGYLIVLFVVVAVGKIVYRMVPRSLESQVIGAGVEVVTSVTESALESSRQNELARRDARIIELETRVYAITESQRRTQELLENEREVSQRHLEEIERIKSNREILRVTLEGIEDVELDVAPQDCMPRTHTVYDWLLSRTD